LLLVLLVTGALEAAPVRPGTACGLVLDFNYEFTAAEPMPAP